MENANLLYVLEKNVGTNGAEIASSPSNALMIAIAAKMKTSSD
jgi:hypothetical protein